MRCQACDLRHLAEGMEIQDEVLVPAMRELECIVDAPRPTAVQRLLQEMTDMVSVRQAMFANK